MLERLRGLLIGGPKNLFDPRIHHTLALVAFFAWVGLGSDGLSSSAYGPEEAFLQLGEQRYLALFLVLATIVTVFLISTAYSQVIDLFPSGGGGYVVATRLLGPVPGLISGGALVVDYVLTITISVASGCDAIFSFLPHEWAPMKLPIATVMIALLTMLNLRGVKESVVVLMPIFLGFMISHVTLLGYGLLSRSHEIGPLVTGSIGDTQRAAAQLGAAAVAVSFLKAYALGGGTYTGIEAVSNSTDILREPRAETGKRTMLYMSISLAFTAGGILFCYLLTNVQHEPGRTLNATLWELITNGWRVGGLEIGTAVVWFTLISEGALLFVAAQTGFVAGPRTLAAMGVDQWVPKRFAHLSERLVTQNGIIAMGAAAIGVLLYTGGAVKILVVMYSMNVFVAFALTLAGMTRHWWATRGTHPHWRRRFLIAAFGTVATTGILITTGIVMFFRGVWVTLFVTGAFIAFCVLVRRHYHSVRQMMKSLDDVLTDLPLPPDDRPAPDLAPDGPTAIVLVESYAGLGIHTLLSIQRLFPRHYKNFVFVSVGLVDSGQFKGVQDVHELENKVRENLERYVTLATRMGYYAEYRYTLGTDLIEELEHLCLDLIKEFRRTVVFAGQLVFQRENLFTRSLHHETAFSIQRRLQFRGVQVIILPIRVWERSRAA